MPDLETLFALLLIAGTTACFIRVLWQFLSAAGS